ncbi:PAS domain-containing sensor histidine kinase [Hyphomonas oceanitis]|uniref:PAS domain-containing sensor histidine kinase n=1 Tax=Hyphomonas oceanitis TaxID=81033 RepID=UPI0030024F83
MPISIANTFSSKTWLITPDLLGVLNRDGYFRGTNPAWEATLGYKPEDIERNQFLDFIHPDDLTRTQEAFVAIQKGLPVLNFENRYRHKNGTYRWLSWNCVPDDGLFYCSARDVTQHHEDLSALSNKEEEARFREQFIAVLGHDLRNPLSAVSSAIRIASREAQTDRALQVLEAANGSIERMAGLINDLMDFARARLGSGISLDLMPHPALAEALHQAVGEIRISHPQAMIEETYDFAEGLNCEASRLQQLMSNLVANALTHGAPGKPIQVQAVDEEGDFVLTVTNAGGEIPDNVMANLFKPFVRGDMRASQQGLGLGLFIAKAIANAHGGRLSVVSDADHTTFEFRMPRKA